MKEREEYLSTRAIRKDFILLRRNIANVFGKTAHVANFKMSGKGLLPNRDLLNVNFEGYKLSETPLSVLRRRLPCPVSTATLKDEFSYQHVRAHSLHNHLHFDPLVPASVYWYAKDGSVVKASCSGEGAISKQTVFRFPETAQVAERHTNATIEFLGGNMGVACAGDNHVVLFQRRTSERAEGEEDWVDLKTFQVPGEAGVMVVTARLSLAGTHVHTICAALSKPASASVMRASTSTAATYSWTRIELRANPLHFQLGVEDVEKVEVLGTFESRSVAMYASFQHQTSSGDEQLLFVSETTPLLDTLADSAKRNEVPPTSNNGERDGLLFSETERHCGLGYSSQTGYRWTQSETDVVVTFQLDPDVGKRDISCIIESEELVVGLTDGTTFLRGKLVHPVDPEASTWTIENNT